MQKKHWKNLVIYIRKLWIQINWNIYTEIYIQENFYDEDYYFINFGEILKYADGLKKSV